MTSTEDCIPTRKQQGNRVVVCASRYNFRAIKKYLRFAMLPYLVSYVPLSFRLCRRTSKENKGKRTIGTEDRASHGYHTTTWHHCVPPRNTFGRIGLACKLRFPTVVKQTASDRNVYFICVRFFRLVNTEWRRGYRVPFTTLIG